MELQTRLNHIHSEAEFNQVLEENRNVMICCGRMGPMCLPVYAAHPEAHVIRKLSECHGFMGLPFTVYFKNGAVVKATTSIQTQDQVESILKAYY